MILQVTVTLEDSHVDSEGKDQSDKLKSADKAGRQGAELKEENHNNYSTFTHDTYQGSESGQGSAIVKREDGMVSLGFLYSGFPPQLGPLKSGHLRPF